MADGPAVIVDGPRGLTRDLATMVLARTGFRFADPENAQVLVLVDPDVEQIASAHRPDTRIVVVTSVDLEPHQLTELVVHGADGVVEAESAPSELASAVRAVADGGGVLPPRHLYAVLQALRAEEREPEVRITSREIDILRCIDSGHSVKQTALALGIAPKTVENLQSRLFRKLGVRNRAQAVSEAHARGLLAAYATTTLEERC